MPGNSYDGKNSELTLGWQLLEFDRNCRDTLMRENKIDKLRTYYLLVDYLDGRLADYREMMSIRIVPKEIKIKKAPPKLKYYEIISEIRTNVEKYFKEGIGSEQKRDEFFYWCNRWIELLSSSYRFLKLVPELEDKEDDWEDESSKTNDDFELIEEEELDATNTLPNQPGEAEQVTWKP